MKMPRLAAVVTVAFALVAGCQPPVVTTPAKTDGDKKGVHIDVPGVKVDVKGNEGDRKVNVDIHPKGTSR